MGKYSVKLAFSLIIAYGLFYLFYFWQTPLGQMPVLDGSENFLLASQIASGSLPHEPFFRSMLYPALLSIPCILGFEEDLFCIASLSGIIFHFINSLLIFFIVHNLWKNRKASIIACLIYGFYPPAVFFAAEPLDTTISITFMLGALFFFFIAIDKNEKKYFITTGLLIGISALFRSNVLPFAIIYLIFPLTKYYGKRSLLDKSESKNFLQDSTVKNSLLSIFVLVFMLIVGGIVCYLHSGEFRLLPWQGASNLYSANSMNANGKYYKHTVYIPNRPAGTNPARAEAEYLYFKETKQKPPLNLNDFNRFWLRKTFSEILSNPSHWISLTLKKTYFLFNNYEQYNNKTFSFHKSITAALHYNPLCFGILIILFFLSLINLVNHKKELTPYESKYKLIALFAGMLTLSLGIIAFYVSARFRIPLASLIIIFSSYLFTLKKEVILSFKNYIIVILSAFLTFSSFFDASNTSTYKEDRLLNAFACSRLGLDEEQILWADRVLEEDPQNLQAIRLKIVGFTNLVLSGNITDSKAWEKVSKELDFLSKNKLFFNDTILLSGCYAWKIENHPEKAHILWTNGGAESTQPELFQACLIYTELVAPNDADIKLAYFNPLIAAALKKEGFLNIKTDNNEIEKAQKAFKFLIEK